MNPAFSIIIPARRKSTRLANKMLLDVAGLPLIIRTYRQAQQTLAKQIYIATDDKEIFAVAREYQCQVIMTSQTHNSGTDRLAQSVEILGCADEDLIINIQGDEPLINPELINQLANFSQQKSAVIATLAHAIDDDAEIFNPNVVKVVLDNNEFALYFSRAPIPFARDDFDLANLSTRNKEFLMLRHVGVYAYQAKFLKIFQQLPVSNLENIEKLEQLRALSNGYKIAVLVSDLAKSIGIDTVEDLIKVRTILEDSL